MLKDLEHFKHAMAGGASGYVLKEDAFEQLVRAIKMIMLNKQYVSSLSVLDAGHSICSQDEIGTPSLEILTTREKRSSGDSFRNGEQNIAANFKISVRTVEAHRGI